MNPVGFAGSAFINGKRGVTGCVFEAVAAVKAKEKTNFPPEWADGLAITIMDVDSICGNITTKVSLATISLNH